LHTENKSHVKITELTTVIPNTSSIPFNMDNALHLQNLPLWCNILFNNHKTDILKTLGALTNIRQLCSQPDCKEIGTIISEIIKNGILPMLVEYSQLSEQSNIQTEALWIITNLASGNAEDTKAVVESGIIPIIVKFLENASNTHVFKIEVNDHVLELSLSIVSNIINDSNPSYRENFMNINILPIICRIAQTSKNLQILIECLSCFSAIISGKPDFSLVKECIPIVANIMNAYSKNVHILKEGVVIFSNIGEDDFNCTERADSLLNAKVLPILLICLQSKSTRYFATKVISNLVSGPNDHTSMVIQSGCVPFMMLILKSKSTENELKNEILFAFSNIAGGSIEQSYYLQVEGVFKKVIKMTLKVDFALQIQCAWVISNALEHRDRDLTEQLISFDICKTICYLLSNKHDSRVLIALLVATGSLLACGEHKKTGVNKYAELVEESGCLEKIEGNFYFLIFVLFGFVVVCFVLFCFSFFNAIILCFC
jgi:hypothetical protein